MGLYSSAYRSLSPRSSSPASTKSSKYQPSWPALGQMALDLSLADIFPAMHRADGGREAPLVSHLLGTPCWFWLWCICICPTSQCNCKHIFLIITIKPEPNCNASSSVRHLAAFPKQEQRSLEKGRGIGTPVRKISMIVGSMGYDSQIPRLT